MEIKQEEKFPLDLRVGEIVEVKDHPGADKLYVLKVDLGSEQRQLVAGLKGYYPAEELSGKKIIVVCNLKPAKLRGIISEGMLLAGEDEKNVGVLTTDHANGSAVTVKGFKNDTKQIKYEDFSKLSLHVQDGKAYLDDKVFMCGDREISVERVAEGKIR
jgi:methionine--tRNA ligase beta chain